MYNILTIDRANVFMMPCLYDEPPPVLLLKVNLEYFQFRFHASGGDQESRSSFGFENETQFWSGAG
jgi:hypothetical protein